MRTLVMLRFALPVFLGLAIPLEAATLCGRVVAGSQPVDGAAVTISSATSQPATVAAGSDGRFCSEGLAPGLYSISATSRGRSSAVVSATLDSAEKLDVVLRVQATAVAEIDVTAPRPLDDHRSTTTGTQISGEAILALPVGRNYTDVARLAVGTATDAVGTTVYGSSGFENQFVIEGINSTGISYGSDEKKLNSSFLSDVQVLTGGLAAEYGRSTGGVIDAEIRNGTNTFMGSVFGYTEPARSDISWKDDISPTQTELETTRRLSDGGMTAGGPLVRDRLWFFAGYDFAEEARVKTRLISAAGPNYSIEAGFRYPVETKRETYAGKLTFQPIAAHSISATLFADPSSRRGALRSLAGPPSTFAGEYLRGGSSYSVRYGGVFGRRLVVDATFGRHAESSKDEPEFKGPRIIDQRVSPAISTGGFGQYFQYEGKRSTEQVAASLNTGNHLLKAGIDSERAREDSEAYYSGGDRIQIVCRTALVNRACPASSGVYYVHLTWVNELHEGFKADDPSTYAAAIVNPRLGSMRASGGALYLQDTWSRGDVALNAGVRIDRQSIYTRGGRRLFTVNSPAPRLGVTWSPLPGHKAYAFAGRYFESIGTALTYLSSTDHTLLVANLDPTPGNFTPDPAAPALAGSSRYRLQGGGSPEAVDPDLKGQSIDEFLVGYDLRLGKYVLGAKMTMRRLGRVIENIPRTGSDAGAFHGILVNPGYGPGSSIPAFDGGQRPTPRPERKFRGMELRAERQYSGGTQMYASYLWSKLEGNHEGTFNGVNGEYALHTGNAFNAADYLVNSYGPLSADRRHQFKLAGSHRLQRGRAKGLEFGAIGQWRSGTPLNAMGVSNSGGTGVYFLAPRGSVGRTPSTYEVDLHIGYPIHLGPADVLISVDVLNALDRQAPFALDQNYNTFVERACTGLPQGSCNGDGGIKPVGGGLEPVARIDDPRSTAPNPRYLRPVAYTEPRSVRLGLRVAF